MTEEYISGYLEAISRVKDIITPNVGGTNQFFSITKNPDFELIDNIIFFMKQNNDWYEKRHCSIEEIKSKLKLEEIENWLVNLESKISNWTCDKELAKINGKNGYLLSEYLINFLLKDFFSNKNVKTYKILPDWGDWHWGDMMSEEYVFETIDRIYIMHLGEST